MRCQIGADIAGSCKRSSRLFSRISCRFLRGTVTHITLESIKGSCHDIRQCSPYRSYGVFTAADTGHVGGFVAECSYNRITTGNNDVSYMIMIRTDVAALNIICSASGTNAGRIAAAIRGNFRAITDIDSVNRTAPARANAGTCCVAASNYCTTGKVKVTATCTVTTISLSGLVQTSGTNAGTVLASIRINSTALHSKVPERTVDIRANRAAVVTGSTNRVECSGSVNHQAAIRSVFGDCI